jgi:WD40 repeat protein
MSGRPLTRLSVIKSHTRPIDSFVSLKPIQQDTATIYSGDSMGVIRCWAIRRTPGDDDKVEVIQGHDLPGHHTSITRLLVLEDEGNTALISASMDSQILYHPLSTQPKSSVNLGGAMKPPITIPNPLYGETTAVRSILILPETFHPTPLLLAGASDEDIRTYEISSTLDTGSRGKEVSRVQGHWSDVIDMDVWIKDIEGGKKEAWVVSASLDATLRRWSMAGENRTTG